MWLKSRRHIYLPWHKQSRYHNRHKGDQNIASLFCRSMTQEIVSVTDFWVICISSQNRTYWLQGDVDTIHFPRHVTAMWTVRVACVIRCSHILVTFGSRCYQGGAVGGHWYIKNNFETCCNKLELKQERNFAVMSSYSVLDYITSWSQMWKRLIPSVEQPFCSTIVSVYVLLAN